MRIQALVMAAMLAACGSDTESREPATVGAFERVDQCDKMTTEAAPCAISMLPVSIRGDFEMLDGRLRQLHVERSYRKALSAGEDMMRLLNDNRDATPDCIYYEALNNVAAMAIHAGRLDRAEALLTQLERTVSEDPGADLRAAVSALAGLAIAYKQSGRYAASNEYYMRALRASRASLGRDHYQTYAITGNYIAFLIAQRRLGDLDLLAKELARVIDCTHGGDPNEHKALVKGMEVMTRVFTVQERFQKAEQMASALNDRYTAIFGPNHPDRTHALKLLSSAHTDQGEYDAAHERLEEALAILDHNRVPNDALPRIVINRSLAESHARLGEFETVIEILEKLEPVELNLIDRLHPHHMTTKLLLARAHIVLGDRVEAIRQIGHVIGIRRNRVVREFRDAVGSEQVQAEILESEIVRGAALSLAASAADAASGDPHKAELALYAMRNLKGVHGEYLSVLQRLASDGDDEVAKLAQGLDRMWIAVERAERIEDVKEARALRRRALQIENRLAALQPSPAFAAVREPLEWRTAQDALPKDAALLEYMVYLPFDARTGHTASLDRHIAAVLLRPEGPPVFRPLGPLDEAFKGQLTTLVLGNAPGARHSEIMAAGHSLYARLVGPFTEHLEGVARVYVAPDDVLHRVPLDLLRTPDGRRWTQRQALHLIPGGRALSATASVENDGRFIAMGGATYGEYAATDDDGDAASPQRALRGVVTARGLAWTDLPHARSEVVSLSRLFGDSPIYSGKVPPPLVGAYATEAALRGVSPAPAILHLATHGGALPHRFAANPLWGVVMGFSGANLAGSEASGPPENDGLVRGADIARLNLHGTQLVTLSACETGAGVALLGEGVMSLAHAFRLAGARSTLMTYWSVDDEVTERFMTDFYTRWLHALAKDPKVSPFEALHATKRRWDENGQALRHWAAFALVENSVPY